MDEGLRAALPGDVAEDDLTVRHTEHEAQANLAAMFQLCTTGRLRCSEKTRRPAAATVKAVAEALLDGDFYTDEAIAAFAWPLLLQAGGLAELTGGRLQLTGKGRTAGAKPAAEVLAQLWRRWVSGGIIDEFGRVEEIKGQRSANVLTSAKNRRKTVATALADRAEGEWIAVDDLFADMRKAGLHPKIARSEMALWKLYIEDPQYGSLGYAGFHEWSLLEGRYTLAVIFEYAATLGLFDLAYIHPVDARDDFRDNWGGDDLEFLSRYDGLCALRLNALGAYVLGQTDHYEPTGTADPEQVLKVLPNLDIVATGQLHPADRLLLSGHAQQTGDRVWALSAGSLLAAIDAGRSLDQFIAFLESRTSHELPGTVRVLLSDVWDRTRQLRDGGVVRVIECVDRALVPLITRDRKLRELCRPLGDRHIAIPLDHEADFRKALRALGYVLPAGLKR
jgi:hypothetical protein